MLEQATNDYDRLYVRGQAKAALAAAEVLKLDDVIKRASVMVQRAERALAKANPAPSPAEAGTRKGLDSKSNPVPAVPATTVQKMRQAHAGISDEQFDVKVKQTLTDPTAAPLTRSALLKESREQRRNEQQAAEAARREQAMNAPPPRDSELLAVSITELHRHVAPNSIDVIFTEPPYGREDLPLYTDLARFAQQALKPGGLLLTLSGSRRLPEIYRRLDAQDGMNYRHHFVYNGPSAQRQGHPAGRPNTRHATAAHLLLQGRLRRRMAGRPGPKPGTQAAARSRRQDGPSQVHNPRHDRLRPLHGTRQRRSRRNGPGLRFHRQRHRRGLRRRRQATHRCRRRRKSPARRRNPWLPGIAWRRPKMARPLQKATEGDSPKE